MIITCKIKTLNFLVDLDIVHIFFVFRMFDWFLCLLVSGKNSSFEYVYYKYIMISNCDFSLDFAALLYKNLLHL